MAMGQGEATKKAEALLAEREEREAKERDLLLVHGGTLVTLRANYPGPDKRRPHTDLVVKILQEEVAKRISVNKMVSQRGLEGLLLHFLTEEEGLAVKRAMVKLEEEHPLGRLVDVDVRTAQGILHRQEVQAPLRRCYLCGERAMHCVRSEKHPLVDVQRYFLESLARYLHREDEELSKEC